MADEDSDSGSESDLESGVGNVNRLVMRPPGHSGKAKKGHLVFDAAFEGGNLGRVDYINEFEYDLFIRPDTCNPRYRVWYNFTVENVRADQRVIFNIVNLSKSRALFREGMTPIVRSTSKSKWRRIPSKYVYYYVSAEHNHHNVLSFLFAFDKEEDVYHFAYCYPYSYSRLQLYLDEIERRHPTTCVRESLTETVQQRQLDLVTITSTKALSGSKKKRVVLVMSRVHPGETPASFVVQGLMDFLLSNHVIAQTLRDHLIFKMIPMLNPDGVFLGNYRTSMLGSDLNRNWHDCNEWIHPTLYATKGLVEDLDADTDLDLDMVLDVHAHSSLLGSFIYGNYYEDVYRFERHTLFPKLLAQTADDFCLTSSLYNRDPAKIGTARRYLAGILEDRVNCYTLEVSFHGYRPNNGLEPNVIAYTEESYMRLGRNVARALFDYYTAIGHISKGGGHGGGRGRGQSGRGSSFKK